MPKKLLSLRSCLKDWGFQVSFRERFSNFRAMALHLIGLREGGFFVPYPYMAGVPKTCAPYPAMVLLLKKQEHEFASHLAQLKSFSSDFRRGIEQGVIPWEDAGMFPKLDALAAYGIVRMYKPKRVIEIGSGASSRVMAQALLDNGRGRLTCIDPAPRRSIQEIDANLVKRVLREDDVSVLNEFEAGDLLFIDSSHVMLPRMDVDIQFNRMFPLLPKGAIVHVHDIFLPDDYPETWRNRNFSEQNALFGWIASGFFEVLFPSYYLATRKEKELRSSLGDLLPENLIRNAGSIWLRKT
jgi:predicted O-methyltransferase YrrM